MPRRGRTGGGEAAFMIVPDWRCGECKPRPGRGRTRRTARSVRPQDVIRRATTRPAALVKSAPSAQPGSAPMRRTAILLALLLVTPLASAQVYKWTDAKGVVHYSDVPPAQGVKYKNMHMSLTGGSAPAAATSASPAAASSPVDAGAAPASARTVADNPENRAKLCAQLRQNYT